VNRWDAPRLEGRHVRLEPLEPRHADGLWQASRDPRTWQWLSIVQPSSRTELDAFVDAALANAAAGVELPLVTLHHDEVVGSTRFLALRPEHGSVEIGWTWLHPSAWGTGVNERSRGAMEAMGATFEGIHRKHMLVRTGENRDSAWYSITDDEWPDVERSLTARLQD
jgi:N-acetyltransferase